MLFSFFILSVLFSMSSVQSIPLFDSDDVVFGVGDQNYTLTSNTESIDRVYVADSWIRFNTTDFNVTNTNPINITLSYLDDNILGASEGDVLLRFTANTDRGNVRFNISGFSKGKYSVTRNDGTDTHISVYTSSSGVLSFWNNAWSENTFTITKGDISPPPSEEPDPPPDEPKTISLSVYIKYNGEPLDQVKVTINNVDKITDTSGRVTYRLPPNIYTIYVYNPLYGELTKVVDASESMSITMVYEEKIPDDSKPIPGFEGVVFITSLFIIFGYFFYKKKKHSQ